MSDRKMTLPEWHHFLEEKFRETPRESIRFFSLEALPRLMHVLDNQRHFCSECAVYFDKLLSMIIDAPTWIRNNAPEVELFRKQLHETTRFLESKHGLFPKGLWLSRFSSFGIIFGLLGGFAVYAIFDQIVLSGILILGAAAGMMLGWILGKIKEHQLKKDGKLY